MLTEKVLLVASWYFTFSTILTLGFIFVKVPFFCQSLPTRVGRIDLSVESVDTEVKYRYKCDKINTFVTVFLYVQSRD